MSLRNLLSFHCWFQCSTTCDNGIMTRKLECIRVDERGQAVPAIHILCQHTMKPPIQIICNEDNPCRGNFKLFFFAKYLTIIHRSGGDQINNSRHLGRKYARIFVRGHYLFREANSFPRAKLEENCELRGTDNVQGQISEYIFPPNGDYCLYYPSNLFHNGYSPVLAGLLGGE